MRRQAVHRTEAASGRTREKIPWHFSATKIELDPILGRAKNEFGTDPSLV